MVSFDLYRVFYIVAKNGSITAAAKEMFITQSAVSQSIKQLERQLGGRLFVRSVKGIELTPEGSAVLDYVERATSLLDEAQNKFQQMKQLAVGRVRMGAGDTLCKFFLLDTIRRFHQRYPEVVIQVTNRTSRDTLGLLRSGKVDLGFVNLPLDEADIDVIPCMQLNDCFVGNADYKDLPVQTPLQLSRLPLMMLETISNSRSYVDRFFLDRGITLAPQIELGSIDLLRDFAGIGMGVACVPREFCRRQLDEGSLYEIKLDPPIPPRAVGLIKLKGAALTFAADRFVAELTQGLSE